MASSQELSQIEAINKGLTTLNGTLNVTATNYMTLVKTIADGNEAIKANVVNFDGLAKAQKQTTETAKQLDSLDKALIASEKKLKETEDERLQTIIKNRLATQEATKAITNKVKANKAEEGSLVAMRIKLSELTAAYDKSGTRTKAAAQEINKLSKELLAAEQATGRSQRNVGNYADAFSQLPGPIGAASSATIGFGKQLWGLMKIPIVAVISGIVLVLTGLFKAFTSTDSGATAFAGAMKAVGNVLDVLMDRLVSFFKLLGSLITFDWEGIKKNGKDAFDGIGTAIKDAAKAGKDFEDQMDSIGDREAASLTRAAKLRKEIQELTVASKDRNLGAKEQIRLAELAMQKAIELNNIEVGFQRERTEASKGNLAAKINDDNLTIESKQRMLEGWLKIDDKQLESERAKSEIFNKFYETNEAEFQALQKARSEDVDKETELITSTRRLQTSLFTFKKELSEEEKTRREKELKGVQEKEKDKAKAVEDGLKKQEDLIVRGGIEKNAINEKLVKDETDLMEEALKDAMSRDEKEFENWYDIEEKKKDKQKDDAKKKEELEKETAEKIRDLQFEIAAETINGIFDLGSAKRDEELSALDAQREKELENKNLTEAQKQRINEEYDKKAAAIKTKQAKADKLQALFNIAISTAQASMKSLAQVPLPLGLPLLLATIALGAVQAGLVLAQPIPKFKDGTKNAPNKGIFGEAGRELMFLRSGEVAMANQATYFEGSKFKGAQILSNPETEKMISMNDSIGGRQMSDDRLLNEMKSVRQAIQNKPVAIFDKDHNQIGHATSSSQTIYLNRLMRNN